MNRANGKLDFSHSDWLTAFSEVLEEFKRDLADRGESHKFIGARVSSYWSSSLNYAKYLITFLQIIYTSLRFATDESLTWCLNDCIEMKKQFPDIICGSFTA